MRRTAPLSSIVLALALVAASAFAANRPTPPPADEMKAHVDVLAAPAMEGRGSGTPGGERAAQYLAERMAAMRLRPGGDGGTYFQWFGVGSVVRAALGTTLERVGSPPLALALGRDWTPYGGSLAGETSGEIVFIGTAIPTTDLKGKIALALNAGSTASRLERLIAARRQGAAGMLIAGDTLPTIEGTTASVKLVSGAITQLAADALLAPSGKTVAALLAASGPVSTGVRARIAVAFDREERRTANVVGILPGTDPALASEAIVLGAHYDHLGRQGGVVHPGADDNASGTAVVLGIARAIASAGGLPRTVVVACFSGEEIGLVGSAYYVQHPPWPLDRTAAMLNFDMVGRLRSDRLNVGGVESASGLRALLAEATRGEKVDLALRDSPYGPSDHASFYGAGVPVLFFSTGGHDDYHAPSDTADKINAVGLGDVARVGLRVAERLGGEPRPVYAKLARPAREARQSGAPVGDAGGAFLGVSVDVRSESDGIRIGSVVAGSGAERAGLKSGDVIARMGDTAMARFEDMRRLLSARKPGDPLPLIYLRDGEDHAVTAILGSRP